MKKILVYFAASLFLLACSKAEIRQATVMTQAEIDAYNHKTVDPVVPPGPGPEPAPVDPVDPPDPEPSDDRITDGSAVFVRPKALGLKDGSSWNNALDATGLRELIAQKLNDQGEQDDAASAAQAETVDGLKIYCCSGKFLLAEAISKVVKLEWTGHATQVKLLFYGGYAGNSSGIDISRRDVTANITLFTGDADGSASPDPNDYRLFVFGNQTDIRFDGITFAYAYHTGNGAALQAAAGGSGNCSLTFENCTFRNNACDETSSSGAALSVGKGTVVATNCKFYGNSARNGGALLVNNDNSNVRMTSCTFSANTAANCGGAVNHSHGKAVFENCTFLGNVSNSYAGGAIHANGSGVDLSCNGCSFTGNEANGHGGAVSLEEGKVSLSGCSISGNKSALGNVAATGNGGTLAMLKANGIMNLSNCTLKNNTTSATGGAIFLSQGRLYIDNCRFEGNSANNRGGSLRLNNGICYMNRSVVTGSSITGEFGVAIQSSGLGALCMNNCTVARNKAQGTGSDPVVNGSANALIVNSTLADDSRIGLFRIEGNKKVALLNSILVHEQGGKPSVLFSGDATVRSLGSCIVGVVSGTSESRVYTPGSGDKNSANFASLSMSWDSGDYLYKWSGNLDGHTKIDAQTIGDLVKTALPVSVTGSVNNVEAFRINDAGLDFYNWVTGLSATAFTTDALGTVRGTAATCGAYQKQ